MAEGRLLPTTNLDLVRSIYAAWERGDLGSAEWADPEVESVIVDGPSPGRWTGLSGMAQGWRGVLDAWEDFRFEAEEFRELDDERVLVLLHFSGRGKTSGLEIGQMRSKGANVFHVRHGNVTRTAFYFDRERAFADLGLAPEGSSPVREVALSDLGVSEDELEPIEP